LAAESLQVTGLGKWVGMRKSFTRLLRRLIRVPDDV
jgi:hypothetical protein